MISDVTVFVSGEELKAKAPPETKTCNLYNVNYPLEWKN